MSNATIVFGGGCFWCTEAMFRDLRGVISAESGYAGGQTENPTYKEVCGGSTGHAEAVRITFDSTLVTAEDLLRIHLVTHDPTTLNRQGGDIGTQYRSVIFYQNVEEKSLAERILREVQEEKLYADPIVTTIEPMDRFYVAEDYHQNYLSKFEAAGPLQKMGMNAGYCSAVVAPKVAKFRKTFFDKLKGSSSGAG